MSAATGSTKNIFRRVAEVAAYALYALIVQFLLLWLLFPAESLKQWLETHSVVSTRVGQLSIGELRLTMPWLLTLTDIEAGGPDAGQTAWRVKELRARLKPVAMLTSRKPVVHYDVDVFGGVVTGDLTVDVTGRRARGNGIMQNLRLEQVEILSARLGRPMSGTLSGSFAYQAPVEAPAQGTFRAECKLSAGEMGLKKPVLGLDRFDYKTISTNLSLADNVLTMEDGVVESRLLSGVFSGTVSLPENLWASGLQVEGSITPRPELFAGIGGNTTMELVKKGLRDGEMPFTLTGTLREPGISFGSQLDALDMKSSGNAR